MSYRPSFRDRVFSGTKRLAESTSNLVLGRHLRPHRIPFGPNAGTFLYMWPALSLRVYLGLAEPEISRAVGGLLRDGDVAYDCGAHIGYLSTLFAKRVGPEGEVHAFELLPSTAAILRRSIELNGLDRCTVHETGLSDHEEVLRLPVSPALLSTAEQRIEPGDPRHLEECRIVSLDDYRDRVTIPDPTLIKLDVEGSENKALRGAERTIAAARPLLIIEFHNLPLLLEGQEWLEGHGYRLATLAGVPAGRRDIADLAHRRNSFLCHREDCGWHRERLTSLAGRA